MLQVYLGSNISEFSDVGKSFVLVGFSHKVHCYLATRPEVEGFRDACHISIITESIKILIYDIISLPKESGTLYYHEIH